MGARIASLQIMPLHHTHVAEPLDDERVTTHAVRAGVALVGRILISVIFLASGFSKLIDHGATASYMTSAGIPSASLLAIVAGLGEMLGGLAVLLGRFTRLSALGLFLFLIPTTLLFHGFWNLEGAEQKIQMINFMKNLAIMGGLAQVVAFGAGGFSLDARRMHKRMAHPGSVREAERAGDKPVPAN
ncbi:MAG: DoxX family protein [Deltaproteobacteria bacterium]|nr:DoxX family protein [Deltaproteobacteria bacterium]